MPTSRRFSWTELVHRQGEHLAGAGRGDEHARLHPFALPVVSRLLQQLFGLCWVVLIALCGVTKPGMAGIDLADRRDTGAIQQRLAESLAVDGIVGGLSHQLIIPGGRARAKL